MKAALLAASANEKALASSQDLIIELQAKLVTAEKAEFKIMSLTETIDVLENQIASVCPPTIPQPSLDFS